MKFRGRVARRQPLLQTVPSSNLMVVIPSHTREKLVEPACFAKTADSSDTAATLSNPVETTIEERSFFNR
jgi:hypothetical protein